MSNTDDIFVEYLALLADMRPKAPTALGQLTVSGTVESEPGEEGAIRGSGSLSNLESWTARGLGELAGYGCSRV